MRHRIHLWFLAAGVIATGIYLAVPGETARAIVYELTALGSVAAIVVGVRLHRPTAPRGWYLLAGGVGLLCAGDITWDVYDLVFHHVPFPSAADGAYFAAYAFLIAGCFALSRTRSAGARRDAALDAAIAALGASILAWHFVVAPESLDSSLTPTQVLVSVAYPLLDLVLIGVVVRMLVLTGLKVRSAAWLLTGFVALLVSDLVFAQLQSGGSSLHSSLLNAGWLVSYVSIGVAALHPSMGGLSHAPAGRSSRLGLGSLFLLAPALLAGPASILVGNLGTDPALDVIVAASLTAIVGLLVLARVGSAMLQRRHAEDALLRSEFHDPLTGLPNRALCLDRLEQAMARSRRIGSSLAVLYLDMDRFKVVNQELGHGAGDGILVAMARAIEGAVRDTDTVARMSGDEFAVVAEIGDGRAEAAALADRVLAAMREPATVQDHEVAIRASVGIALAADGEKTAEGLLANATSAMYRAKDRGRNRYEFFDLTMRSDGAPRIDLETELRRGIDRGELRFVYQPVVELETGRVVELEALVRWLHPTRGLLPPSEFIPLAEESDLIVDIGTWGINEACRQLASWKAEAPGAADLRVAVNIAPRHFRDVDLPHDLMATLARSGGVPGEFCLELTETSLMEDVEATVGALSALKVLGFEIAVDDFGTGYSSLSYLQRLPVDILKIDRAFVMRLAEDPKNRTIVTATIAMAHALDLSVVAEGVETEEQLAIVRDLGCDRVQGYLFARPLEPDAAIAFVRERRLAPVLRVV